MSLEIEVYELNFDPKVGEVFAKAVAAWKEEVAGMKRFPHGLYLASQVQVDFGNVPLEWEYLNQYHGVRHPLSMTAFGPK